MGITKSKRPSGKFIETNVATAKYSNRWADSSRRKILEYLLANGETLMSKIYFISGASPRNTRRMIQTLKIEGLVEIRIMECCRIQVCRLTGQPKTINI